MWLSYGTFKYEVFSIYEEKLSDYPTQTEFLSDSEYLEFLNTIKNKSIKGFNVQLSVEKSIITLTTLESNGKRVIVHAVKEN